MWSYWIIKLNFSNSKIFLRYGIIIIANKLTNGNIVIILSIFYIKLDWKANILLIQNII